MPEDTQFYLSAIDNLKDPARTSRWRLLIPTTIFGATKYRNTNTDGADLFKESENDDIGSMAEFALHVKTCKIPDVSLEQKTHDYMGFKSFFVTNAKIDADFPFETILLEDARAYEAVLAWHQACLNTGLLKVGSDRSDSFTGDSGVKLGLGHHKDDSTIPIIRNQNIKVEMYNWYTGKVILAVNLINAVPTKVDGWNMNYTDGDIAKFNFNLHADRWTLAVSNRGGDKSDKLGVKDNI